MDKPQNDLSLCQEIAGYCRISVDEEQDQDNTSIENQKKIIQEFVRAKFPKCILTIYEDRDRSGYTFEQREQYQQLRKRLMSGEIGILIVKDFSRFSRRNSKGLVELEDLRDAGVRIISIGDSIDYPTFDDWMNIQFRFLVNEMPVTETSKKIKNIIAMKQSDGEWLCTVPYGYVISNMKKQEISVVPDEAEVVKKVFELYTNGWGYKKIANYLTDANIPTPRMKEKQRVEERGDESRRKAKQEWSIATIQGILNNDFYIGTLRQHKYTRRKIHGADKKTDTTEHFVFENNHKPIIDYKTWAYAQELLKKRTTSNYRGIKKYDNVYSGFLFCGDCGSPMFAMSRSDIAPAYTCGTYHKRGVKGCSSHHIRVDFLDIILKEYVKRVRDNSDSMIKELEDAIKKESTEVKESETTFFLLDNQLEDAKNELKAVKKRKIKELARADEETEEIIEETYTEIEDELIHRIKGLQNQINMNVDKRNDIIRVNRLAKTVINIFNDILEKQKLDKRDIELMIEKMFIYENHIDIKLRHDIDNLIMVGEITSVYFGDDADKAYSDGRIKGGSYFSDADVEEAVNQTAATSESSRNFVAGISAYNEIADNTVALAGKTTQIISSLRFEFGSGLGPSEPACRVLQEYYSKLNKSYKTGISETRLKQNIYPMQTTHFTQKTRNKPDHNYAVNVIREGDPLEIFTDREGEIILKKYSPIGELGQFAQDYADSLAQTTGQVIFICDRDQFIAASGTSKRDWLGKSVSDELENAVSSRENVVANSGEKAYVRISGDDEDWNSEVISPIISEGDVIGAVLIMAKDGKQAGETEMKLASTAASFLGRQMEN